MHEHDNSDIRPYHPETKWDDSEFHPHSKLPWWRQHSRQLIVFAVLFVLMLAVIIWLPSVISTPTETEISSSPESTLQQITAAPQLATAVESPWQSAQLAKARREAQEILAKLLDRQTSLENMHVKIWAEDEYESAIQLLMQGDDLYTERQFDQAQASYLLALQQLDTLIDSAAKHFEKAIEQGLAAIEQLQPKPAIDNMTLATLIQPESSEAQQGLARAQVLDQVVEIIETADNHLLLQQFDEAKTTLEEALKIDPQSQPAQDRLTTIKQRISDRNFASTMGSGYHFLQQKLYTQAIDSFQAALSIQPSDANAKTALAEAKNQKLQAQIQTSLRLAAKYEAEEQWQSALSTYEQIQKLDKRLVAVRIGLLRSQARWQLDREIQQIIDEPLRLADNAVLNHGQQLLRDAYQVKPQGSRIASQAKELQARLDAAQRPIQIQLQSDNQTEVTLYRIGKLGSFANHTLQLTPGHYTAVGSRNGYRDVREEFTVMPNGTTKIITIRCTERISRDG